MFSYKRVDNLGHAYTHILLKFGGLHTRAKINKTTLTLPSLLCVLNNTFLKISFQHFHQAKCRLQHALSGTTQGIWQRNRLQLLEEEKLLHFLAGFPYPESSFTSSLHASVMTESLLPQERWEETRRERPNMRKLPSCLNFSSVPDVTSGFMQVLLPVRLDYFPSPNASLVWLGD